MKLQRVILKGFKSIKEMDLELRPLNILIGANGAGKSTLVSFFKMLNEMMAMRLQQYVGTMGRAQSILHFGPKVTPQMEARLGFEVDNGIDTYAMRLFHAARGYADFCRREFELPPTRLYQAEIGSAWIGT